MKLFSFYSCAFCASMLAAGAAAGLTALEPAVHEVGELWRGERMEVALQAHNPLDEPIAVRQVRSGCKCLEVLSTPETIPAKGHAQVKLAVHTETLDGPFQFSAYLEGDAGGKVLLPLRVQGNVKPLLSAAPQRLTFRTPWTRTSIEQVVQLERTPGAPLQVAGVSSEEPHISVSLRTSDQPGTWAVVVTLLPEAPVGRRETQLVVALTDAPLMEMLIPVTVHVLAPLRVSPAALGFAFGEGARGPKEQTVQVLKQEGIDSFRVTGVEAQPETLLDARLEELDGARYAVTVSASGVAPETSQTGHIRIHTDQPAQPVIDVPVRLTVQ